MVALITGISGQDGYYLAKLLHERGDEVWGTTRSAGALPGLEFARLVQIADLSDQTALERAIATANPDEIYHLAAQSSVVGSWDDSIVTAVVTGLGTVRLLEAVRRITPLARVFVASSSEVFGNSDRAPQDEYTRIAPVSPYGAAKAFAQQMSSIYRQHHGLYVAVGILYKHDSPRRSDSFVTQKIVRGAVAIARGKQSELRLGNLEDRRDWGFAGDHVRAMGQMLQQREPGDHVIASGESHSVREWCELAFAHVCLNYRGHVLSDAAF